MTSSIQCSCGRQYQISPGMEGKAFRCKACGEKVHVPLNTPAEDVLTEADLEELPAPLPLHDELEKPPSHRHRIINATPEMLTFSLSRYLKCNPLVIYVPLMLMLALPFAAYLLHLPLSVGFFTGFIVAAFIFTEGPGKSAQKKMQTGSLCAGKIIQTTPYVFAVITNLSHNGSANKLAIGVRRQRLGNMSGGPPRKGDRILVSVNYSGRIVDAAWEGFNASVVACACDDPEQIEKATAAIDPADWKTLDHGLDGLKIKPGEMIKLWEKEMTKSDR